MEIRVERMHRLENSRTTKAFVDIAVDDAFVIKSVRVVKGRDGLFVSMPQEKSSKDHKWYDRIRCLDKEVWKKINKEVLAAYESNMEWN